MGQRLNLTCLITGDPQPLMIWTKNGLHNITGAKFLPGNTTLLISRVSISDEAVYLCLGKSPAGETSTNFSVVVQG